MNFLSSKMELSKTIKEQKAQIEELETEKARLLGKIEMLSAEVVKNKKKSEEYENKYVRTNLECSFCFNMIQKDGTTHLKLAALPVLMDITKITKITGNYNNARSYLFVDKVMGCEFLSWVEQRR